MSFILHSAFLILHFFMTLFLQQLLNGLSLGSIYALVALGYTMVYGVLRLINFAHGDVYMLGAFAGFYASKLLHGRLGAAGGGLLEAGAVLILAMLACALVGIIIERFAYRPVRRASRLTLLIVAIGVSLLIENLAQMLFGADPKFFPQILPEHMFNWGGVLITNQQILVFVTAVLLMLALTWFIRGTRTGKAMRAVSHNADAARLMGINVNAIIALVSLNQPSIDPIMGLMTGIKAFVAAVLGGIGSIPGAVLGGLIIGLAETFVAGYGSSTYRDAIAFLILIVILLCKPEGILGKGQVEKV
jgi:branched-chain amino acid transport system permease protein